MADILYGSVPVAVLFAGSAIHSPLVNSLQSAALKEEENTY